MQLARFKRRNYTPGFTPIERMDRLGEHLQRSELYIKRDDLLGLTAGGNKTRKLEYLVADALEQGADTLITVGAVQSNHCRLTAAAAVREGLKCRLVLEQRVPGSYRRDASGNNFLFDLLGVENVTVVDAGDDLDAAMEREKRALTAVGRTGYIIPGGGSNALGALGYAACAEEILQQGYAMGVAFDRVVVASGSGGTHAGLLVGFNSNSAGISVTGINVRRGSAEQEGNIHALAAQVAQKAGAAPVPREMVQCRDEWVGPGYSLPTDEMVAAVRMFAAQEGILLDPVYTGKAAAGLIGLIRSGEIGRDQRVLFVHTGGSPALYAYQLVLSDGAGE